MAFLSSRHELDGVSLAARTSRRVVLTAFAAALLLSLALVGERMRFLGLFESATQKQGEAQVLAQQILFLDERLTMLASVAVETADPKWERLYQEDIPKIERAIESAIALAGPALALQLKDATWDANERLVQLELQAFEWARQGRRAEAVALLPSPSTAATSASWPRAPGASSTGCGPRSRGTGWRWSSDPP